MQVEPAGHCTGHCKTTAHCTKTARCRISDPHRRSDSRTTSARHMKNDRCSHRFHSRCILGCCSSSCHPHSSRSCCCASRRTSTMNRSSGCCPPSRSRSLRGPASVSSDSQSSQRHCVLWHRPLGNTKREPFATLHQSVQKQTGPR